ncbi:hypothetical protein ACFLZX_01655 [Nanoarchaeota archaeon]
MKRGSQISIVGAVIIVILIVTISIAIARPGWLASILTIGSNIEVLSKENCISLSALGINQPNSDGDDLIDECDRCILCDNPEQEDFDGDGIGDHCEDEANRNVKNKYKKQSELIEARKKIGPETKPKCATDKDLISWRADQEEKE